MQVRGVRKNFQECVGVDASGGDVEGGGEGSVFGQSC